MSVKTKAIWYGPEISEYKQRIVILQYANQVAPWL